VSHAPPPRRTLTFRLLTALLVALCAGGILAVGEWICRAYPISPWHGAPDVGRPVMLSQDPELGWRPVPGRHEWDPAITDGKRVVVSYSEDGERLSSPPGEAPPAGAGVLFIGGSFTAVDYLDDADTFPWLLQRAHPAVRIRNYGVGGYGTYQSLLKLREVLADGTPPPGLVVYSFLHHHIYRNVAAESWLNQLAWASYRGHAAVPHCTVDDAGQLQEHPPAHRRVGPLERSSALFALVERVTLDRLDRRQGQALAVMRLLLTELNATCKAQGAMLVINFFGLPEELYQELLPTLEAEGISDLPNLLESGENLTCPWGDGHPNEAANRLYAANLDRFIGDGLGFWNRPRIPGRKSGSTE
jgi:hypothetical protein